MTKMDSASLTTLQNIAKTVPFSMQPVTALVQRKWLVIEKEIALLLMT